jgi:hypothetical protein
MKNACRWLGIIGLLCGLTLTASAKKPKQPVDPATQEIHHKIKALDKAHKKEMKKLNKKQKGSATVASAKSKKQIMLEKNELQKKYLDERKALIQQIPGN